jgi:hypothetical protein
MKITPFETPRPLLDWVLQHGRQLLRFQVHRTGNRYQVSVLPGGQQERLFVRVFRACPNALQLHAALVAGFRDAGWTSVAYR